MMAPWMIEKLRREREERTERERPALRLPLLEPARESERETHPTEKRGVAIIDFSI